MRIDKVTHQVFEEFGGKTHSLSFTLSGLQQLEVSTGNLFDLLEKQPVPSLTILTTALWIALGGRKKLERKEAEELATDYFRENGIEGMTKLFYATLGASGVLGKATTNELFKQFGLGEYADEAESTEEQADGEGKRKNVRKARA